DLDRNVNTVKNREVRADLFAVTRLRAAYIGRKPMTFAAAMEIVVCLGNVSFNLMGSRVLDHFGASALNSPDVFGDGSYTHPNLELRFLLMNYRFYPSKTSRGLVDTFLARRRKVRVVSDGTSATTFVARQPGTP